LGTTKLLLLPPKWRQSLCHPGLGTSSADCDLPIKLGEFLPTNERLRKQEREGKWRDGCAVSRWRGLIRSLRCARRMLLVLRRCAQIFGIDKFAALVAKNCGRHDRPSEMPSRLRHLRKVRLLVFATAQASNGGILALIGAPRDRDQPQARGVERLVAPPRISSLIHCCGEDRPSSAVALLYLPCATQSMTGKSLHGR
jgi:hypothetical protein